jgi:hypothetical protein
MSTWQDQEAEAQISSVEDYENTEPRKKDLRELLLGGPKFDEFEIERESDLGREIDLSDLDEQ